MVYTTYLWWFGGWFIIVLPTVYVDQYTHTSLTCKPHRQQSRDQGNIVIRLTRFSTSLKGPPTCMTHYMGVHGQQFLHILEDIYSNYTVIHILYVII